MKNENKISVNVKGEEYTIEFLKDTFNNTSSIEPYSKRILISLDDYSDIFKSIIFEILDAYLLECGLVQKYRDDEFISWIARFIPEIYEKAIDIFTKYEETIANEGD